MRHAIATAGRMVVDNDWGGDPDGLVALAHHLLSPSDDVVGVTSSFLNPMFGPSEGTAEGGRELAAELLTRMAQAPLPLAAGADTAFDGSPRETPAARLIVDAAAQATPDAKLTVVCGGPLTNVADAIRLAPDVVERTRLLWVGGLLEGDGFEYNRDTDAGAATFVFAQPELEVIRFPAETYRLLAISVAELEERLTSSGALGGWLWERYEQLPLPEGVAIDPVWPLGDSAPLAFTALRHARTRTVPGSLPHELVCVDLDERLIIEDLFARLRLAAR
ncbi:nucleoside hydrolase [Microbacterium sp. JZ37]|uniref:nucleoside hydrolase n=1 Tax=Microbacterium sp. JZ37 TaxID=2654193 RepID=UPI002B47B668|nr:nucleoside hydrolase [Microbacterium sp. JZ37]WRH17804.1 hypothetical protein GC092_09950 [Microbacterium sp. JZ37]